MAVEYCSVCTVIRNVDGSDDVQFREGCKLVVDKQQIGAGVAVETALLCGDDEPGLRLDDGLQVPYIFIERLHAEHNQVRLAIGFVCEAEGGGTCTGLAS